MSEFAPQSRSARPPNVPEPPSLRPAVARPGLPMQAAFLNRATLFAAILLVLTSLYVARPSAVLLGATLAATVLLLLAHVLPNASERDKRESALVLPLGLALLLWLPDGAALTGSLCSGLLVAFWSVHKTRQEAGKRALHEGDVARRHDKREQVCAQAAAVTLALGTARLPASRLPGTLPIVLRHVAPTAFMPNLRHAQESLGVAFLIALTCAIVYFALLLLTHVGRWSILWMQNRSLWSTQLLGLLFVVLLAPLGAAWGIAVFLPLGATSLLLARNLRLTRTVEDLHGQMKASEAMGQASVAPAEEEGDDIALLARFLSLARVLVPAERSLIWTLDSATGILTPAVGLPDLGPYARTTATFGQGLVGHAAARFSPRRIADASSDPYRTSEEAANGAMLLYPIVLQTRLIGVAQWIRPVGEPFTRAEISRLDSLVPQAAIALENARVREVMRDMAATDGLTGLWNHRRLQEILREEVRRADRYHRSVSVLMMDVDSFKSFNDTYGHPQGDALLQTLARVLQGNVRAEDTVGRYGGEEFMIILPETQKDAAYHLADRIRAMVETKAGVVIDGQVIRRTVSMGLASFPEDGQTPAELVQRADDALYRAKREGKNRVIPA